jgi:hypothetical protein
MSELRLRGERFYSGQMACSKVGVGMPNVLKAQQDLVAGCHFCCTISPFKASLRRPARERHKHGLPHIRQDKFATSVHVIFPIFMHEFLTSNVVKQNKVKHYGQHTPKSQ